MDKSIIKIFYYYGPVDTWYDPMRRLTEVADSLNVSVVTPIVVETTIFNKYIPQYKWWEEVLLNVEYLTIK